MYNIRLRISLNPLSVSMSLRELSHGKATDKDTVHSYLDTYESLFRSRKDAVINIMEIGILDGGSIRLWRDYFQNATVTALDISPKYFYDSNRIRVFTGDAYTTDMITKLSDRVYDIIIDDGPHTLESMQYAAAKYTSLLSKNGLFIIEDVQDMSWVPEIIECFPEEHRAKVKTIDLREKKNRWDDILIVLDLSE